MNTKKYKFIILILSFISLNIFADATGDALTETGVGMAKGAAVGAAASYGTAALAKSSQSFGQMSQSIGEFMASPLGIGIVSGVGLANSYILRQAANDQSIESGKNIEKIEQLMAAFKDSYKCLNGRDSLSEPQCYCYNEDGTKNTNRSNSETCKTLWAAQDYLVKMDSESFKNSDGTLSNVTGCITTTNQFDENCKCKRMVNSSGQNACKKVSTIATGTLGSATSLASTISKLTSTVNTLSQGNASVGNLNGYSLAVALKKQSDQNANLIASAAKQSGGKINMPTSDAFIKKMQNQLFTEKGKQAYNNLYGSKSTFDVPLNTGNPALQKAVDQLKKAGVELNGSGKGIQKKAEGGKEGPQFNFNENQASNGAGNNAVEFAEKNYNYKQGEITKDAGASIFEIISHRYIESGIRRLFEEDVK